MPDWLVLYSAGAWKGEGWRALGGPAPRCMASVNKQTTIPQLLCSCAPSTTLCSVAWTSEFHSAPCPGWLTDLSKPRAYAATYLFRPLCSLMFRFALVGWSPQARSLSAIGRAAREGLVVTWRCQFSPENTFAFLSKGAFLRAKGKRWL